MGLLKQFEGMQLPAASELEWLVPEHDAPQKVDFEVLSLSPVLLPDTESLSDLVLLSHMLTVHNDPISFLTHRKYSLQMC